MESRLGENYNWFSIGTISDAYFTEHKTTVWVTVLITQR